MSSAIAETPRDEKDLPHLSSTSFLLKGDVMKEQRFTIAQPADQICPIHGEVVGLVMTSHQGGEEYSTPKLCPKCWVDWHTKNITNVVPK